MSRTDTRLDMTMMYAVHDALRRDLRQIERLARAKDDSSQLLGSGLGWQLFSKFLQVHHGAEDASIWPVVRARVAGQAASLKLLDDMEAEHEALDPLLADIDTALHDHDRKPLGDLVGELVSMLSFHLDDEELRALPLIDATMTPQEWKVFSEDHRNRVGADARQFLPWLLDGVPDEAAAIFLERIPAPMVAAYRDEWAASFRSLDRWGQTDGSVVS